MKKIKSGFEDTSLDLHGVKHMDAKQTVISFVEDHWNAGKELHIITGNSLKMKGIVMNVLDEYKLTYQVSQLCYGKIVTWT